MCKQEQIVRSMIEACSRQDVEAALSYFRADAIYHNIPIAPVQGLDAIRGMLAGFLAAATSVDWQIHHMLSDGNGLVMNERTDYFDLPAGKLELPVMGVFEVRDGKIAAWRDYFDMGPLKGFSG
ncbi:MAG: limonene,2-epoxide hydrolase [Rhodospirillales bacterium]|nr:limonene,2-epoxide hydrolase [Rhodospirillales bacterium]